MPDPGDARNGRSSLCPAPAHESAARTRANLLNSDHSLPTGRLSVCLPDPHDGIGYDPLRGPIAADDDRLDYLEDRP
jgi:hypothetical protein